MTSTRYPTGVAHLLPEGIVGTTLAIDAAAQHELDELERAGRLFVRSSRASRAT